MPSKFGETLEFILQLGRHLGKFRRINGGIDKSMEPLGELVPKMTDGFSGMERSKVSRNSRESEKILQNFSRFSPKMFTGMLSLKKKPLL